MAAELVIIPTDLSKSRYRSEWTRISQPVLVWLAIVCAKTQIRSVILFKQLPIYACNDIPQRGVSIEFKNGSILFDYCFHDHCIVLSLRWKKPVNCQPVVHEVI